MPPPLAEVSDKIVGVPTFWLIGVGGAALVLVLRHPPVLRLLALAGTVGWFALNATLALGDDPMRDAILAEQGRAYFVHQMAAAALPLGAAVALVARRYRVCGVRGPEVGSALQK